MDPQNLPPSPVPPYGMTIDEFRERGMQMVNFVADYYQNLQAYPVRSQVQPGYLGDFIPPTPPADPEEWTEIFADIEKCILPGITHFQSPHFHAYFPAGSSFPAQLAEMLSNCFNAIGFSWINSPALTELETIMMDWLVDLLGLPRAFRSAGEGGGCIQGTASEGTFVAVLAARTETLEREQCSIDQLVGYISDQGHGSYAKAFKLAGILPQNVRVLSTKATDDYSLSAQALRHEIEQDKQAGLYPFFIGSTLGTTPATHYDRLDEIGPVAKEYEIHLHVDAAYAGSAFICPEYRYMMNGIEYAETFLFNPHKWMLVNFDCSVLFLQHRNRLLRTMITNDEIYSNEASRSGQVLDYRNWQVPLGRRFRALKLWFVLRCYGKSGLQAHIRRHCALALYFEKLLQQSELFQVAYPTRLGLVCFRVKIEGYENNASTMRMLDELNADGSIFIVHSSIDNQYFLRFCLCSATADQADVTRAYQVLVRIATKLRDAPKEP